MNDNMKTAIGYVRVSGDSQVDGDGFTRQSDKICTAAERHGFFVKAIYYDGGISGTSEAADRPALSALLAELTRKDRDEEVAVIVENSTRLARDTFIEEMILRRCVTAGISVYGADNWTDLTVSGSDNPTALLTRKLLGAFAEFEKNMIVQRLRTSRDRIREKFGKCEGPPKYGRDAKERTVIATIVDLRESCGLGYYLIAKRLTLCGVPAPRSGKEWSHQAVRKIYLRFVSERESGAKVYNAREKNIRQKTGEVSRKNAITRRHAKGYGETSSEPVLSD